jgi:hypothetical protein
MKDWKQAERQIARLLGSIRVPTIGHQRGVTPKVEHERSDVEVKRRKSLPVWLLHALTQAQGLDNVVRLRDEDVRCVPRPGRGAPAPSGGISGCPGEGSC